MKADLALDLILMEYHDAIKVHLPFNNPHEGFAVILEELDELWDEIKATKNSVERTDQMKIEAAHLAAMALRFMVDMFP